MTLYFDSFFPALEIPALPDLVFQEKPYFAVLRILGRTYLVLGDRGPGITPAPGDQAGQETPLPEPVSRQGIRRDPGDRKRRV